jgi:hypothetical protein
MKEDLESRSSFVPDPANARGVLRCAISNLKQINPRVY